MVPPCAVIPSTSKPQLIRVESAGIRTVAAVLQDTYLCRKASVEQGPLSCIPLYNGKALLEGTLRLRRGTTRYATLSNLA